MAGNLATLNTHLQNNSYIAGYEPTKADLETLQQLDKAPAANFVHVLRWYNHLKSFTQQETSKFPAGTSPLKMGATTTTAPKKGAPAPAPTAAAADDDVDLFGSEEEDDAEAAKLREERLKAYNEKKSKKPALIAKSSIVLDVKPWDDETDMKELEKNVRTVVMDGLVWGASKLIPVGYGIHKLQIMCVVEDDKVSVDELVETIQEFEDYVQSVDIAAFNKI